MSNHDITNRELTLHILIKMHKVVVLTGDLRHLKWDYPTSHQTPEIVINLLDPSIRRH